MKIFVCLKEVPSRDTRYEIGPSGNWINETDLGFEINECDEYALEEALKLQEKFGGEVVLLTVGAERAEKSMRKGLAMGADRGVLVEDGGRKLTSPFAIASALAEILKKEQYDLILAGTQSDDYGYAQTGVMLAELLDLPHATIVMEVAVDPGASQVTATREMESGWFQRVQMSLPAVLAIQAGISQIRFTSLKGIMAARRKEVRRVKAEDLGLDLAALPSVEVSRLYLPDTGKKAEMLRGDAESVVAQLVEKLRKEARVI